MVLSVASMTLWTGCGSSEEPSVTRTETIATFDGGEVTLEELDRRFFGAASEQIWDGREDVQASIEEAARIVAFEDILLALAEESGEVDNAVRNPELRDLQRRAATRALLATLPAPAAIDREMLAAHFEERREEMERPERRRVQHIFQRYDASSDREAIADRLALLRQRAIAGENFGLLAAEHSDSETRHQEGALGEVVRGQFPADFDNVVFSLEEGVPSDPVFTPAGGHLFLVTDVLPERRFTLEDVGPILLRELRSQQQTERLRQAAGELLEGLDEELLPAEYFSSLLESPRPPQVLFRVGDVEYRLSDFRRQSAALGPAASTGVAASLLEQTYYQEVVLQHGPADSAWESSEYWAEELRSERRQLLLESLLNGRLRQRLSEDDISQHYERHRGRFTRPVQVGISRLGIDLERVGSARMEQMEAAVADLDAGHVSLEDLAARWGGELETWPALTLATLKARDARAVRFAFALQPGQHAPPYTWGRYVILFRLDDRREAEQLGLEEARAEVIRDLLSIRRQDLYLEFRSEVLTAHAFRIDPDRLAQGARLLARLPE